MASEEASTPMLRIGPSAVHMATVRHSDDSPVFGDPEMSEACDSGVLSQREERDKTTAQTIPETTMEPNKILMQRIIELEEENSTMASKLRGYKTLGQMYHEEKKKVKALEKKLQSQELPTTDFIQSTDYMPMSESIQESMPAMETRTGREFVKQKRPKLQMPAAGTSISDATSIPASSIPHHTPSTSMKIVLDQGADLVQGKPGLLDSPDHDKDRELLERVNSPPLDRTFSTPNLGSHAISDPSFVHIDMSGGSRRGSTSWQLRSLSDQLVRHVGNGTPPDAVVDLIHISPVVDKMEKQLHFQMDVIKSLTEEKAHQHDIILQKDEVIKSLREQVDILTTQVNDMTHQEEQDWISVDRPEHENQEKQIQSLQAKVAKMQTFIKSLAEKNKHVTELLREGQSRWEVERKQLMEDLHNAEHKLQLSRQTAFNEPEMKKMHEELKQEKEERRRLQRQLSRLRVQQEEEHPSTRGETASSLDSMSVKSASELRDVNRVLRQQVLIYKEDFEGERKDREKAQAEKDDMAKKLKQTKEELSLAKNQKLQREIDVVKLTEHNGRLKQELIKLRDENRRLKEHQRRMYQQQSAAATAAKISNGVTYPVERLWPCFQCTYENAQERAICEICGTPRRELYVSRGRLTNTPNMERHGVMYGKDTCDSGEDSPPQYPAGYTYNDIDIDTKPPTLASQ